jgi:hypothetical protein
MACFPTCPVCEYWDPDLGRCRPKVCPNCQWCVDGSCLLCGGDHNLFCCCNGCYWKGQCLECVDGGCWTCGKRPFQYCCNGQCYDERTQGCCNGKIYDLETEQCCWDGTLVCGINEACCNGQCYDPATQKCCSDTLWGSKYVCGISETCCKGQCCSEGQACCNTSLTGGTCYNTATQKCCPGVSGGYDFVCDIDEICCDDGSCAAPCEEVSSETPCSSEKDSPCPACVGITGNCSDSKAEYYTDETIYNCSGGCPGPPPDCGYEYPAPPCYDTYFCADYIYYRFAKCATGPEPGDIPIPPGPLDCWGRDYPWGCTRCNQGGFERTWDVVSRICY